jgi:protein-S-isoprenylcysteine O-methyltransferase Ste14
MSDDAAQTSKWAIGEVIFGFPLLFSIALQFLLPFSLPRGILSLVLIPTGIILVILGIWIISLARREFSAFNQPTDPGQATGKIIKTSVFAVSRNPLYLGAVLVVLGFTLAFNFLWGIFMLLISMILCHHVLILPEEQYLAKKFGDEYVQYQASVHRWVGRK